MGGAVKRRENTLVPGSPGKPQGKGGMSPQSGRQGMNGESADQEATLDGRPDRTLESLAESVAGIQLQLGVIVEWLETIEGRLDAIDERLEQGY